LSDKPAALFADRVAPVELLELLSARFGGAEGDRRGGAYFPRSVDFVVRVRFANDRITKVEFGPGATPDLVQALQYKVQAALLDDQQPDRTRRVVFSAIPVAGVFKHEPTAVALAALPPEALQPPAFFGDHPFLIEVPFVSSRDPWISMHRQWRALDEWIWLLNTVLLDRMKTYRSHQAWFLSLDDPGAGAPLVSRWGSESYASPGLDLARPIDPTAALPMPVMSDATYYGRIGVSVGDTLSLPASFPSQLAAIAGLGPDDRRRLLQAGHWLTAAVDLWGTHMASWYIAQVAAIESLVYSRKRGNVCPTCGLERGAGPTRRFKEFLDKYAPGGGTGAEIRELYRIRSGLVHGSTLLHHDSPMGSGMLAFVSNEREPMDRLSRVVTISLVNWLSDPARQAARLASDVATGWHLDPVYE
jgi:hypothetical protein